MNLVLVVLLLWLLPSLMFIVAALVAVPCKRAARSLSRLARRRTNGLAHAAGN
ncbi:cytochrome c-type biogenesis protein CcmH/NrfF [Sphingomonas zeicaulis]|uniref:hypothetical protein n=1 Tax=Sphingomonas zeicaulis TaxID=1632740 RepID=UPI003D194CCA